MSKSSYLTGDSTIGTLILQIKHMSKKFYLLFTLTIALAASAFALWCVNKKAMAPVVSEPTATQNSGNESIDTSDWKTYRNEEYGFELKMPNNWPDPKLFEEVGGNMRTYVYSGGHFEGCCQGVRLEVIQKPLESVYQQRLDNLTQGDLISSHEKKMAGMSIREIIYDTHYGKNERIRFVPIKKNYTLELGVAADDKLADQIVATFSFLKFE